MTQRLFGFGSSRALAVLGSGLLAAICFGFVAGRWPAVAIGGTAALVIAAVMFKDLAAGVVIFTVTSFAGILSTSSGASAAKLIGGVLVLAWLATLARRPAGEVRALLRDHRGLVACSIGLVAWSLLSTVWAQSASVALLGASRYAQDIVLFPIVYTAVKRSAHARWVTAAFVVGSVLAMLYGAGTGSSVDGSRLVGAIGDPNETATVLVVASVLALGLGAGEMNSRRRRWLAFAAAAVALIGMVATASRGGMVALGATAVVAVVMGGRWRRELATAVAVAAVLAGGWFAFFAPSSSISHLTNTETPRTTLWTVAGRTISANPIVGVGNDNFQVTENRFLVAPGVTTRADQVLIQPDVAHNIYLEVWADTGVVGLLLFAAVVLIPLRAAWRAVKMFERAGRRSEEILTRALIVAITAMLSAGFFISDEYSKQLFLLLALACGIGAIARRSQSQSGEELVASQ